MTALVCDDVRVRVGDAEIVNGVSLAVDTGQWVTIVGPNGAGKTTLLRAIAGLTPHTGTLTVAGHDSASMRQRERAQQIAVVPQDPVIPLGMAVLDYVLLGRTPHIHLLGNEGSGDIAVVRDVLQQLELSHLARRAIETLSGGERQRTVLARALAQQAPLLLLDEPTSALDLGHQQDVLDLVDDLRATRGLTVIATMHDLTVAGQYADRVALLDRGRVFAIGPPIEVLTEDNLSRLYGARVRVLQEEDGTLAIIPLRRAGAEATVTARSSTDA